ncbi:hypothetical protein A5645_00310 [Mycobacterium asiaticum]|nr:hypothetical protein A5645_00310 [Mycobacterium asiaticum]
MVSGRKGFFDDLQLVIDPGLQLKDHTTVADSLGLENYVALTAIGDGVTGVQMFDGHQFRVSV